MRITAQHGPDHWIHHFERPVFIELDGVRHDNVVEADDEAGYIVKLHPDFPPPVNDEPVLQRLEGRVTIIGKRIADCIHEEAC